VDKVKKGKGRVVNERFATMCAHHLVEPDFCNVASGWEKGVVEKPARVSSTCLVSVVRNRYCVPCELYGRMVSTRLYPVSVVIVADDKIVACHDRLSNAGETRYDSQHYIPLLQRKPGALRNGAPFADMPEPLQRLCWTASRTTATSWRLGTSRSDSAAARPRPRSASRHVNRRARSPRPRQAQTRSDRAPHGGSNLDRRRQSGAWPNASTAKSCAFNGPHLTRHDIRRHRSGQSGAVRFAAPEMPCDKPDARRLC
jgi:hypothetical protein